MKRLRTQKLLTQVTIVAASGKLDFSNKKRISGYRNAEIYVVQDKSVESKYMEV